MSTNTPVTVWRDTQGLNEYGSNGPNNIIDPSSNFLIDPSLNQIIDTGVLITRIPSTTWVEDESA